MTPNQFELHAGSGNKRPPEYIYLDNGNTLRDVLNACRDVPLDSLEVNIQSVIGCPVENKTIFCVNCKGTVVFFCFNIFASCIDHPHKEFDMSYLMISRVYF